jgi:cytochrome c5
MSRDRSTRAPAARGHIGVRAALAVVAGSVTLGCGAGAAARTDAADSTASPGTPPVAFASATEAAAMAPPPEAALLQRAEAAERAAMAALPKGAGHDIVVGGCISCHSATMIAQQHKDTAGWNKTVTQMVAWGAPVTAEQRPVLVAYLAEHYPARAQGTAAKPVP